MQRLLWSALIGIALVGLVLSATPCAADDESRDWESALATHELNGPDGRPVRIGDLQGEVVVVNFWASWCKPCRKELRVLNQWALELAGDPVSIVAVSIDREVRHAERFLAETDLALPLYHDGPDGLAKTLDLPSLPCTVVLDTRGRIVKVAQDGSSESLSELRRAVNSLLPTGSTPHNAAPGATG